MKNMMKPAQRKKPHTRLFLCHTAKAAFTWIPEKWRIHHQRMIFQQKFFSEKIAFGIECFSMQLVMAAVPPQYSHLIS